MISKRNMLGKLSHNRAIQPHHSNIRLLSVNQSVVFEAKFDTLLASLADHVEVHESCIDFVITESHLLRIAHVVILPVAQLIIT